MIASPQMEEPSIVLLEAREYPKWFRPWRLLLLFSYAMLLVWTDQGTFSASSVTVRAWIDAFISPRHKFDLKITASKQGSLPNADNKSGVPGFILSLNLSDMQFSILGAM